MHGQTYTGRHPACRWRASNRGHLRLRSRWGLPLTLLAILVLIYVVHFAAGHYRDAYTDDDFYRLSGLLQVQPGMTVAEIGAGEGRVTAFMANQVGSSGMIFSTEIDEDRLEDIRQAAAEAGHQNVTALLGTARETNLPAACCDAIFLVKVYHHFTEPTAINQSLFESLKPGGRLAVIDFPPSPWVFWLGHPDGVPENRGGHGTPREILIKELEQAGFVIEHDIPDWWTWPQQRICVVARKPDSTAGRA